MSSDKSDTGAYLGWFFFGAALGAVVALLTTPSPRTFWSSMPKSWL